MTEDVNCQRVLEAEVEHKRLWDRVIRRRSQRIYSWIEHGIDYTVSQYLYRFHKCKSKREQYKTFNKHLDVIFGVLRDTLKEIHDGKLRNQDESLVLQLKAKYTIPRKTKKRKFKYLSVHNLFSAAAAEYWACEEAWDAWLKQPEHAEYYAKYRQDKPLCGI